MVKVMAGRSKGKTGKVLSVNPTKRTRHRRARQHHQEAHAAESVEEHQGRHSGKEGPIHVSNVMLVCPGCGKHTRVGHTTLPDGTKVRVCRRCNTTFEN